MLAVSVYLYAVRYCLLDPRDTQSGHAVPYQIRSDKRLSAEKGNLVYRIPYLLHREHCILVVVVCTEDATILGLARMLRMGISCSTYLH